MFKGKFYSTLSLLETYNQWQPWWFVLVWTDFYLWNDVDIKWEKQNDITSLITQIDNLTNSTNTTTDITLDITYHKIICDATYSNIIVTLPSAVWLEWKQYIVTRLDNSNNSVIIEADWTEKIYWELNQELYQYETLDFSSDWIWWL